MAGAAAAVVLATGRDLSLTLAAVDELLSAGLPRPGALICSVGSEIFVGEGWQSDEQWASHITQGWDGDAVRAALAGFPGLEPQPAAAHRRFKASYFLPSTGEAGGHATVTEHDLVASVAGTLADAGLSATLIPSAGRFLDVLPERASKGAAVAWLLDRTATGADDVIVAGDSGNDREMLLGTHHGRQLRAVVVGNHEPELADMAGRPNVYVATAGFAAGVLEGIVAHGW